MIDNNQRNNNGGIARDVPQRYHRWADVPRTPIYLQFLESQSDTSIASPGVMGVSSGVVKLDADVDDGTDISAV